MTLVLGSAAEIITAPVDCVAQTFDRSRATATPALTSGTLYVMSFAAPAMPVVNTLTTDTGTTAKATGTHGWMCVLDTNNNVVAVTADQVDAATTWQANQRQQLPAVVGSSLPYLGLYRFGICVVAGTMPALAQAPTITAGISGILPVLLGTVGAGLTTPPVIGQNMGPLTSTGGNPIWGYVG